MFSHDIGKMGESFFENLCNQVDVTANRSFVDRYGWDFFIEFPDELSSLPLDIQPAPIEAKIQIKSTNKAITKCQIKLSALYRLVKDTKPAFILFFHYEKQSYPQKIYLLHIDKTIIAKVLQRVRKSEIENKKLNKQTLVISYSQDNLIENIDAQSLFSKMKSYISKGLDEYQKNKAELIRTIGYDEAPMSLTMEFDTASLSEIIDMSLGLRDDLEVKVTSLTHKRFDITLPFPSSLISAKNLQISIGKTEGFDALLSIKKKNSLEKTSFYMKVYLSAFHHIFKGKSKILLEGTFFKIILDFIENKSIFQFQAFKFSDLYTLEQLHSYLQFLSMIQLSEEKEYILELELPEYPKLKFEIQLEVQDLDWALPLYESVKKLYEIYFKIDIYFFKKLISIDDIIRNSLYIDTIYTLLFSEENSISATIKIDNSKNIEDLTKKKALFLLPTSLCFLDTEYVIYIIAKAKVLIKETNKYEFISYEHYVLDIYEYEAGTLNDTKIKELQTNVYKVLEAKGIELRIETLQYLCRDID